MIKHLLSTGFVFAALLSFGQTTVEGSFEHDGEMREYRVYVPEIYDGTEPVALLFNLHGYGSNNIQQESYGDFRPVADTAGFVIVHPMGLTDDLGTTHWNCFGTSSVDDVGFLSQLIDTIYSQYNIDGGRIYSTGMSNGGFMSYKLACLLSGRITAVASVTGSITNAEIEDCITNHPMPVMQIHGTADATVPYDGNIFFMPVEDVVDHWVDFNECNPDPIVTEVPDIDATDGCTATHYVYEGGLLESTVEFYKIDGGEHTWPGSAFETGVTNQDFNASAEIWRFFSKYHLTPLTSSIDEEQEAVSFEIYPNPTTESTINLRFSDQETKQVTIYNAMGQTIYQETVSGATLNLAIEEKGIFLISVLQKGETITKKLIRQ